MSDNHGNTPEDRPEYARGDVVEVFHPRTNSYRWVTVERVSNQKEGARGGTTGFPHVGRRRRSSSGTPARGPGRRESCGRPGASRPEAGFAGREANGGRVCAMLKEGARGGTMGSHD